MKKIPQKTVMRMDAAVGMQHKKKSFRMRLFSYISLILLFSFAAPPAGLAVTIESFEEPFNAVLNNLMTNYWPADDSGNWMYDDFDPCGGYDAPQYSAELLYPLALDTGNALYSQRANQTVEYVIGITNLMELLAKLANGEDITEEGASLPALMHGHRYYSGPVPFPSNLEISLLFAAAENLVKQGETFGIFTRYSAPAAVAYYELMIAYSLRDKGIPGQSSQLARQAYSLIEFIESYWVQVNDDVGYYNESGLNSGWHWALTLQTLALAYQASGEAFYLDRAQDLMNFLEDYWDDTAPYGYLASLEWELKVLSSNHLMAKALLILYDATSDPAWLERTGQIIGFMTDPMIVIEDVRFPGYSIIGHDWEPVGGTNPCSCSGCNFAVLAAIYMYNRLEQEGPSGVDLLPACMIATAAFGSEMEDKIDLLRSFRDTYLMNNRAGKALVAAYYKYSPPFADFIAEREWLRGLVRILLMPVVGFASLFV